MKREAAMLSVVIISHNQKDKVKRCIESVLDQVTDFPVEVIVSDDNSTDGTRAMLLGEYKDKVLPTFFNSNEFDTSYVLQRAALNRINGLKCATGKYLIHIDGDDFFTGTDLFQCMVDTLENHPECNLCCQNFCILPEDKLDSPKEPFSKSHHFKSQSILPASVFMLEVGLLVNSCFCARRTKDVIIENLTNNTYDDGDITIRYMGNSKVACLDRCDFVYVKYNDSSCSTISENDKKILFKGGVCSIQLAPGLAGVLLKKYLLDIFEIARQAVMRKTFSDKLIKYFSDFDMFIFRGLSNNIGFKNWYRYLRIMVLSLFLYFTSINSKSLYRKLYRLSVKPTIPSDVII